MFKNLNLQVLNVTDEKTEGHSNLISYTWEKMKSSILVFLLHSAQKYSFSESTGNTFYTLHVSPIRGREIQITNKNGSTGFRLEIFCSYN